MERVLGEIPSHMQTQEFFVLNQLNYPNEETKKSSIKHVSDCKDLMDIWNAEERKISNYARELAKHGVYGDPIEEITQSKLRNLLFDLSMRLLEYDVEKRLSASKAMTHSFFEFM
jgi:serine/threonine protein kinase